jgi:uridine kinase
VLEGILVMADPALRALMDHRVFVHTPEHVRLHRRLERDQRERGRDQVEILEQYFRTVRPMHFQHVEPCREHATLVLDGQGPIAELVRSVLELL